MAQANLYDVFMVDPPWPKKKGGIREVTPNQTRELDYPTMPVVEIYKLLQREIFSLGAADHVVFLWIVDEFLESAERNMQHMGYTRHARMIWDKQNGVAPGFTVRYSHEYLNWYYKGKLLPIDPRLRGKVRTVFTEPSREHSRKPDLAYQIVNGFYPTQRKFDVFSREKKLGWDQFGNQTNHFN